jgi:hypothetical protein
MQHIRHRVSPRRNGTPSVIASLNEYEAEMFNRRKYLSEKNHRESQGPDQSTHLLECVISRRNGDL